MRARRGIRKQGLALLIVAIALSACQSLPPVRTPDWPERRAQLLAIDSYQFSGRLAVAAAGEGFNASLDWRQQGSRSDLALRAPFGLRAAEIRFDESSLRVVAADGVELRGDAADQLLLDSLGFAPPLRSLRYWLLGSSDPASRAEESLDTAARLQQLRQDGWQIDYESYQRVGRQWLPERMRLQRDTVRVRLVIGRWQLS